MLDLREMSARIDPANRRVAQHPGDLRAMLKAETDDEVKKLGGEALKKLDPFGKN